MMTFGSHLAVVGIGEVYAEVIPNRNVNISSDRSKLSSDH